MSDWTQAEAYLDGLDSTEHVAQPIQPLSAEQSARAQAYLNFLRSAELVYYTKSPVQWQRKGW